MRLKNVSLATLGLGFSALSLAMSSGPTELPSPIPAPESNAVVRFIAIGDMGTGDHKQDKVAAAVKAVCEQQGCDFAIGLGDNIYESGVDSSIDEQFKSKFEDPYAAINFPFYMTLGNHDNSNIGGDGLNNFKGEYQVEYHYRTDRQSEKWKMPARYYTFSAPVNTEQPTVDFFSLDSNPIGGAADWDYKYWRDRYTSAHADWLNTVMPASKAPWKIAFAHHPYLSNGKHGNAGKYDGLLGNGKTYQTFLQENVCNRVDVIIAGHDHDMQWLKPTESCGRTHFILSGAGGKTRAFGNAERNEVYWQADNTLGFFWVEIKGNEFHAKAFTVNSDTGDYVKAFEQTLNKQ